MHAYCCALLDRGIDPRTIESSILLEDYNKALQGEGE